MKMKLDFTGVISHLDFEPDVTVEISDTPKPSASIPSLRKRIRVDYTEMEPEISIVLGKDTTLGPESTVSDHDYVTKKPKLATEKCRTSAAVDVISTQTVGRAAAKSTAVGEPETKYRERRDKNNEASRRSRQIRKQKYIEMDKEADDLEIRNDTLRKKIVELEALAKTMKAMLIQKMTAK